LEDANVPSLRTRAIVEDEADLDDPDHSSSHKRIAEKAMDLVK
jgi:hypothetical protein